MLIDYLIALIVNALCFYAGMTIANKYHTEQQRNIEREIRLYNARMKANDYAVYLPEQPKDGPITQEFMDHLKENGRATQRVHTPRQSDPGASAR